ncbi:MAG: hypothetical protein HY905_26830 [Deltaproteobacteria bacterium]|nr:hypothetical protein [Deltaproteobacteria bacterium]
MRSLWILLSGLIICLVASVPRHAEAVGCDTPTEANCTGTYCEFHCSSGNDRIVLGELKYGGAWQGVGVCVFNTTWPNAWVDREMAITDSADYRVFGGDGNDIMRLAKYNGGSGEACDSGWTIHPLFDDSSDTFMFWGDAGTDNIHLCGTEGTVEPSDSDCRYTDANHNAGRADGRAGADSLYGSPRIEEMWGGSENDTIKTFSGSDTLHGGPNTDTLDGGEGCDALYGDDPAPTTDGDTCYCGPYTWEGDAYECQYPSHCPGCFDGPEGGSQAVAPYDTDPDGGVEYCPDGG